MQNNVKKIAFIAHEFGLFKGHGGIASYLYQHSKYLLENSDSEVYVFSIVFDDNCDLKAFPNFHYFPLVEGDLNEKRELIKEKLIEIRPNYVEISDFLALGLGCLKAKLNNEFQNTVFATNSHTASKECFEWSNSLPIKHATNDIKKSFFEEKLQLKLSDYCLAPANFLANYVQKNYQLAEIPKIFFYPCQKSLELQAKSELINKCKDLVNIEAYSDSFNISIVSRFEGRKRQEDLVNAFISFINKTQIKSNLFLIGNSAIDIFNRDYRYNLFKKVPNEYRENIHFFDFMSLKQQESIMAITDLVVMTSTFENCPLAMIDTVSREIPILTSKSSGCADYIGETNMTYDPFIEGALQAKIEEFSAKNEDERTAITKIQKNNLVNKLNPETCLIPKINLATKTPIEECKINVINLEQKENDAQNYVDEVCNFLLITSEKQTSPAASIATKLGNNKNYENSYIIITNDDVVDYDNENIFAYGAPVFIPNVNCKNFDKDKSLLYNLIIECKNRDKNFFFSDVNIPNVESRKLIIDCFIEYNKLNLKDRYYEKTSTINTRAI